MDSAKEIRHIPDFPHKGIDFIDITTVIKKKDAFHETIDKMTTLVRDMPMT